MADSPAGLSSQAIHGVHWMRLPLLVCVCVRACALAWISVVCHSGVVSLTWNSENCHLWIFSDRQKFSIEIPWNNFYFLGFERYWNCQISSRPLYFCLLIVRHIQFFPSLSSLPNTLPLLFLSFPFPSPFFLFAVYQHHCYSFTSFIQMDQHPLVEYDGCLLFLHLSSYTNWPALITKYSLETVAFGLVAFGLYQWTCWTWSLSRH